MTTKHTPQPGDLYRVTKSGNTRRVVGGTKKGDEDR